MFSALPTSPVEYSTLDFPLRPSHCWWPNNYGKRRDEAQGEALVAWLRDIEDERSFYAQAFFVRAGCDAVQLSDSREACVQFDRALHPWLRRIYASQEGTYWTNTLLPNGAPSWPTSSDDENHDFRFEVLEVSLFIDIALLVVSFARQADPTLEWVLSRETFGQKDPRTGHTPLSYLPTLSPGDPHLYPITQVAALAQQILCRVDSKSWVKMWDRYTSGWTQLGTLYEAIASG